MKRLSRVKIEWSSDFAYAIGLITTDGNLSKDGRHLNMTSKDKDLIILFKNCLGIKNKIGRKAREKYKLKKYFQVQFGDKNFYDFLISIGLSKAKSKTVGALMIPNQYFADFLRGCIDGDGNINVFWHPESKHPQLRLRLASASKKFLEWIQCKITEHLKIKGGWINTAIRAYILNYAKEDSIKLLNFIYYDNSVSCLNRKFKTARPFLRV